MTTDEEVVPGVNDSNAEGDVDVLSAGASNDDEGTMQEPPHECSVVACVQVPKADWAINMSSTWSGTVRTAAITMHPWV